MRHSAIGLILAILAGGLLASGTVPARADGLDAGLWRSVQTPTLNGIAHSSRWSERQRRR